jgi:D5 N terminal like
MANGANKYRVDNFKDLTEEAARKLFGSPDTDESRGGETVFKTDRVKVSVNNRTGAWVDFKAPIGDGNKYEGGRNCFSLVMRELRYTDKADVWEWLVEKGLAERQTSGRRPTRIKYAVYRSADGEILYREARQEYADTGKRKSSWGEIYDGGGGYATGKKIMDGIERVPYRLQEINSAPDGAELIITEGFPKADILVAWGFQATAVYGGAGGWDEEEFGYSKFFVGKNVILIADTDGVGRKFANRVGKALRGVAAQIREVVLPRLEKPKEDIVEWKALYGGTAGELRTLIDAAPLWSSSSLSSDSGDEEESETGLPPKYSEDVLALKFADRHAGQLIYVHKFGQWYKWDGNHWKLDEVKEAFNLARKICREASSEISNQSLATFRRKINSTNSVISRPQTPSSCTTVRIHPRSA